jgi:hypothetical protein
VQDWRKQHLKSIHSAYAKSPFFIEVYTYLWPLIDNDIKMLSDFNANITMSIAHKMGITTRFLKSSLFETTNQRKDKLLVSICQQTEADYYLSARGSALYIEQDTPGGEFYKHKIQLFYHNYEHPVYAQQNLEFRPYLCFLDLLFNYGFNNSIDIIRLGRMNSTSPLEMKSNINLHHSKGVFEYEL